MCFAPQPRGILEHLNFKNGSGNVVFCTFWLSNVLFATAACHFSPVRRTATSAPAALASLLFEHQEPRFIEKTQRFATSLTFFAHVELLASDSTRMLIFLLVTWLMLIFLLVTWLLCDSAFQLYILSEVRLLNFLRLLRTTKYYSSTTRYYSVLQSTTKSTTPVLLPYYKVLLQYYSVLQSTTPVRPRTTKYHKVLLQYYSVPQSTIITKYYSRTTPYYKAVQKLPKWSFRARLPTILTEEASKMIVSCEASDTFDTRSFQNDRFVRGILQFWQKKLPKWSFRARLLPNLRDKASKTSVSREAPSKFRRTSFQNERFARGFCQIS